MIKKTFSDEFKTDGAEVVREKVAMRAYGEDEKHGAAIKWLNRQDPARNTYRMVKTAGTRSPDGKGNADHIHIVSRDFGRITSCACQDFPWLRAFDGVSAGNQVGRRLRPALFPLFDVKLALRDQEAFKCLRSRRRAPRNSKVDHGRAARASGVLERRRSGYKTNGSCVGCRSGPRGGSTQ
jgi:hypothetical protein